MNDKIEQILLSVGLEPEEIKKSDFVEKEIIDSIMMAEIIIEIEDEFGIEIDAEDIIPENFRNIDAIINLVCKSRGESSL